MTIFINPLFPTARTTVWPYDQACHMISDQGVYELNGFARKIGLKASYLQTEEKHGYNHYDLNDRARSRAVNHGAVELDPHAFAMKVAELKLDKWLREHTSDLGAKVREIWVEQQKNAANPKPHHLTPYNELDNWNKWIDDEIGKELARYAILAYTRRKMT